MRRAALAVLLLLAACQTGGPAAVPDASPTASPSMAAGDITVTPIRSAATSAPKPERADPEKTAEPAPPPPPVLVKSAQQLACERKGGRYVAAGDSGAKACVSTTRDAGKRCTRESDCDGLCLARSQTCAPVKPLFGCNDILQADGRRVTLCVD